MHHRAAIRQAVVARLVDATLAGARVHTRARESLPDGELPALIVVTPGEAVGDRAETLDRTQLRALRLEVHCVAQGNDALADELDELVLGVEKRLAGEDWLAEGLVAGKRLDATTIGFNHDGSRAVAVARLDFVFTYHATESAPETAP